MTNSTRSLSGKNAFVTGVSRHNSIGAGISLALAQAGANVFTTYFRPGDPTGTDPTEAREIIARLQALKVNADGMEADLADDGIAKLLFDQAESSMGPVDILINNATLDIPATIYTLDAETMDRHCAVNIRAAVMLCSEFASRHDGRLGGRIVNMTSGQSLDPMPESLPYSVTKGAIEALTLSLSASLIPKGITVNAIDPGATDTGWISSSLRAELQSKTLGARIGMPSDTANLISFLVSQEGGWINGQVLHSRGGA